MFVYNFLSGRTNSRPDQCKTSKYETELKASERKVFLAEM